MGRKKKCNQIYHNKFVKLKKNQSYLILLRRSTINFLIDEKRNIKDILLYKEFCVEKSILNLILLLEKIIS